MTTTPIYTDKDRIRFFAKTQRAPNGCLIWTGATSGKGCLQYGQFSHGKLLKRAHRVAFEMARNVVLDDQEVRHVRCRNTVCVEAAHLAAGTHAENMDDKYRDLSMKLPDAPLTPSECEYIRSAVDDHGGTVKAVAFALGGVDRQAVTKGLRLGREAREWALTVWSLAVLSLYGAAVATAGGLSDAA